MTSSSTNATAHLDGRLVCSTLRVGVLDAGTPTPVVTFLVIAGMQQHPVWALERLAAVIYCYCQAVRQTTPADMPPEVEVSLSANIISGPKLAALVAHDVRWHTSKAVRDLAEPMIARLTGDHSHWKDRWPSEALEFPVQFPAKPG